MAPRQNKDCLEKCDVPRYTISVTPDENAYRRSISKHALHTPLQ